MVDEKIIQDTEDSQTIIDNLKGLTEYKSMEEIISFQLKYAVPEKKYIYKLMPVERIDSQMSETQ